jgi:uncharacterized membrane protein (UPF0136 family)
MFDATRIYLFVFGLLTIAGGVLGFVKAKSRASLIAGSLSGVLLLAAGYVVGSSRTLGLVLGLVISVALLGRFGMTFRRSRKMMPAGVMTILALAGGLLTTLALATASGAGGR